MIIMKFVFIWQYMLLRPVGQIFSLFFMNAKMKLNKQLLVGHKQN